MDHNVAILFLLFAAAILLYAALLAITRNYKLLHVRAQIPVKPKDPEKDAVQLAKAVALVGAAIGAGAALSFWYAAAGIVVMIGGTIAAIWYGTKIVKN